ncbi:Uncharacterised protein [Pseudomonas fragi]|uniref:Uncharacterized protein n=1 Tax=Pseudomonas fragi TaxID=296 RepID=A0A449IFC4_PSEFR|nr:Uncharacterised protein [Pseudomonas fragi]
MVEHLVDGAVAENRHPRQGKAQRNKQHAEHELADGPATGNTRNKQAYKGRPCDPPGPIEHGPAAQPVTWLVVGIHIETFGGQCTQVVTDVLHQSVEQVLGGASEQHKQQQGTGQQHVDVGHHPHALGRHRRWPPESRRPYQRDQAHLHPLGMGHAEQVVEAGIEVQHPKAHVGAQTEHRGDNAETIHRITDGAVDALADQRVERRAQRQRQVMPGRRSRPVPCRRTRTPPSRAGPSAGTAAACPGAQPRHCRPGPAAG